MTLARATPTGFEHMTPIQLAEQWASYQAAMSEACDAGDDERADSLDRSLFALEEEFHAREMDLPR